MHERSPAQARRDLRLLADVTSGRQPVARVREAIGSDDDRAVPVRVYSPLRASGTRPLLVYFHGGGFVVGDLDTVDGVCRSLANMAGAVSTSAGGRSVRSSMNAGEISGSRRSASRMDWL